MKNRTNHWLEPTLLTAGHIPSPVFEDLSKIETLHLFLSWADMNHSSTVDKQWRWTENGSSRRHTSDSFLRLIACRGNKLFHSYVAISVRTLIVGKKLFPFAHIPAVQCAHVEVWRQQNPSIEQSSVTTDMMLIGLHAALGGGGG